MAKKVQLSDEVMDLISGGKLLWNGQVVKSAEITEKGLKLNLEPTDSSQYLAVLFPWRPGEGVHDAQGLAQSMKRQEMFTKYIESRSTFEMK